MISGQRHLRLSGARACDTCGANSSPSQPTGLALLHIVQHRWERVPTICAAVAKEGSKATAGLRSALKGKAPNTFQESTAFLRELGIVNQAEIARIIDIATNPNSLFSEEGKRTYNASARPLTVEDDMRPVVDFLQDQGISQEQVRRIIVSHPPILSYRVEERLKPFFAFMKQQGIESVGQVVADRPSILGLEVDRNLRLIVDWMNAQHYSRELIVKYLCETI